MRFYVRGVCIIDSEGEFNFPIFESTHYAKQIAFALNKLAGDSE